MPALAQTPPDPPQRAGSVRCTLPDGRILLSGGTGDSGPVADLSLVDPTTGGITPLPLALVHPRAWHTASILPDGRVFIYGGIGPDSQALSSAEIFDPAALRIEEIAVPGLKPRAHHNATVLVNGTILIAGGSDSYGSPLLDAQLWDPKTTVAAGELRIMTRPRLDASARLLPDGNVQFTGGTSSAPGSSADEIFDVINGNFQFLTADAAKTEGPSRFSLAFPGDRALGAPVDTTIGILLTGAAAAKTVDTSTVRLSADQDVAGLRVVPSEGGRLLFLNPSGRLLPATTYTVRVSGLLDTAGEKIPAFSFSFTTRSTTDSDPESTSPISSRTDWRRLPPLTAPAGVTALAGQALTLDGRPLANVTLKIKDLAARTDATGRFLLSGVPEGHQVLVIDGSTASDSRREYGYYEASVIVDPRRTTALTWTIYMTELDRKNFVRIPSPTVNEVVLRTPAIPGLEVHIPAGATIRDHLGRPVTEIGITAIPVSQPPFPLPKGVEVPIYYTIQPGNATIEVQGRNPVLARIYYPNYTNQPAGARANFWHYEPSGEGWYVYGGGGVTSDGRQVIPDPGLSIDEFSGAMINYDRTPPNTGPAPGGDAGKGGDPVDLSTGLFVLTTTDLALADVLPLSLTRTYRTNDGSSRPFGIGATHGFETFIWSANQYQEADLISPDGGRVHYVRISSGTGYTDAVFESTVTPTPFYKSRIAWNGAGWNLTTKDGAVFIFGFNAPLQGIRDRHGNKITIYRAGMNTFGSPNGNITKILSPNGRWLQFTYDAANRITQALDNAGRTVSYAYDATGRLTQVTDANGGVTTYTYDSSHRMLTITDPRNITTLTNTYDANGRVSTQTMGNSGVYQFSYTLSPTGLVTETDVTDPRNNVHKTTFNSAGYRTSETKVSGATSQQFTITRDSATNFLLSSTDPLGRTTAFAYDGCGNLTTFTRMSGTSSAVSKTFTYQTGFSCLGTFNLLTSVTDGLGHTTSYTYDPLGNTTAMTDPLNHTVNFAYNTAGQKTSVTDYASGVWQLSYDYGDLSSLTNPLGKTWTRFTDLAGRTLRIVNPLGQSVGLQYDNWNHVTAFTNPLNSTAYFNYDADGNTSSIVDHNGNTTTYTYDNMDRLSSRRDPLLATETFQHDLTGNYSGFTSRRSNTTSRSYDGFDLLSSVTHQDGSTITYTHDAAGRLVQAQDSITGTVSLSYDNLNHTTTQASPAGSITYTYDAADRRTSMQVGTSAAISYSYDNANHLTQITQGTSTTTLAYDTSGRRSSVTYPNGISEAYTYDAAAQMTGITYSMGSTQLGTLVYTYDDAGRVISVGGTMANVTLPSAISGMSYNANNEMVTWGGASLTYDADGNLTYDGSSTYTWDARGQLASVSGPASLSFSYDAFGRRLSKTSGATTTSFVVDGFTVAQELVSGTPSANIVAGFGFDEVFTRSDAAGTWSLLKDVNASTVAAADGSGTIQTQYTYQPFGTTSVSGTSTSNPYQFTGRESDASSLVYYRMRYYQPNLQRFLSEDPLVFRSGMLNPYAYAGNNPVTNRDPLGLQEKGGIEGCALGIAAGGLNEFNKSGVKTTDAGLFLAELEGCMQNSLMMSLAYFLEFGPGASGTDPFFVIGRYPDYVVAAEEKGGFYFDVGKAWNNMTDAEKYAAENAFLGWVDSTGYPVYLASGAPTSNPGFGNPGYWTWYEYDWLLNHGWYRDGDWLRRK
jgi:RHS repeat-associated protein